MFSKAEIFLDIQKLLHGDYAGYLDKQDVNHPVKYSIDNNISAHEFEENHSRLFTQFPR